ncbi:MORN repeat-containing protein 3-like [Symsagittifera roscoffensis]|uniref:MORN repeat-containing protein 3-like n=1 Tax=Symsagittifera roscoffensis TaxID=84072 RepID=UPI00307BB2BF
MPFLKELDTKSEPLWKEWDEKANKSGLLHTVYWVNGNEYAGDWVKNKKTGKGTQKWKNGAVYDGDWKDDKMHGFGTLSIPDKNGGYKRLYAGGWKNGKRHGYGTQFYPNNETFEGEWYQDKRSGWGRHYYVDTSVYEGEWYDDMRHGKGMLRLPNDNRYEGQWLFDKKNGPGSFYYLDKGQLYEGVWKDDIPKCGQMIDYGRDVASNPTQYPLSEVKLADAEGVLDEATNAVLNELEDENGL